MNAMKKITCSLVAVAVLFAAAPVRAADVEVVKPATAEAKPIASAIQKSGVELASQTPKSNARAASQKVPTSLPKTGSSRVRKQGGGSTAMIIGLVSTLVGVGATVYMVKEMNKDNDGTR